MNINNFKDHDEVHADALVVPPPPAPPSAPQSVVSVLSDEEMYPVSALHAHEPHMSFMDKFAVNLDLAGPEPTLATHNMGTVAPVDSVSVAADDSEDDDESVFRHHGGPWDAADHRWALGSPPSHLSQFVCCLLFVQLQCLREIAPRKTRQRHRDTPATGSVVLVC
ncbi:hypothetical protein CYMTET_29770 [Cymbomonas tetramitiformis]|uniref:Uncharacterized protein n=1 Tax=Cymbomonas tetramitiformis TaxID=36881 RepID=A0AAE0KUK5_9CHLO|nr:hypothetical protein CYMTET_29770 [Cymbomonas tetramitiformis]